MTVNHKFRIPKLKVGTIDTLIALSDDLAKLDFSLAGLTKKIKRTFDDTRRSEPSKLRAEERQLLADHHGDVVGDASSAIPTSLMIGDAMSNDPHSEGQSKTPREALHKFRWNRYVYNESDSIDKLRLSIIEQFSKSEDELRRLLSEYNEVKGFVTAQERKEKGSLLVRPISKFIRPEWLIETEHLTTVILAVPRAREADFLATYQTAEEAYLARHEAERKRVEEQEAKEIAEREAHEKAIGASSIKKSGASKPEATEETAPEEEEEVVKPKVDSKAQKIQTPTVVPGSALKVVSETDVPEDEFVLYRVVLFKRVQPGEAVKADDERSTANVEKFKMICRENRWTVRAFRYDAREEERNKLQMAELLNKRRARWEHLILWCESQFEEAFGAWTHVLAMRTYVEAILRYGLSTEWISVLVNPAKGQEKKTRDTLNQLYGNLASFAVLNTGDNDADLGGLGEYYPYVSISVDFQEM
jgi:hypothetical protein